MDGKAGDSARSSTISQSSAMLSLLTILLFALSARALYFYVDGPTQKCFFEELPKDTLVVGHFKATQWNEQARSYQPNPDMGVFITVDELFDHDQRVVSQRGGSSGKFTFTAADAGEHRLCLTPTNVPAAHYGFLSSHGAQVGGIRLELDLAIGATSALQATDRGQLDAAAQRVRDLNARLNDIRREQVFQREREAEFRDQSESVNARVVRWALLQCLVLGLTCAWQLTYLRAFFIKQKLT